MKTRYPDAMVRQFIYESEEWGRRLVFLKQENSFCKSRLAEMVDAIADNNALIIAEKFNDEFLSQDGIINFLIDELKKQQKLLEKHSYPDSELPEIINNQEKLRNDIQKAELIFSTNKKSFSVYLNELI